MPDSGSFREVARSVTVSYPIPFLFASLLGFALSCFGMALVANGTLSTLLVGTGICGTIVSFGLATYAVVKRPELLRSERYSLMHRALDVIGNTELDAGARREVSSTMTDLLAENVPRRTSPRNDVSKSGR